MNKKVLIIIAVAVLVFAAGGIFIFLNRPKTNPQTNLTKTTDKPTDKGKKTLAELMSSNNYLRCTWSQKETNSTVTFYTNGTKHMRSDTQIKINGEATIMHLIYDGQYNYMWQEQKGKVFMAIKTVPQLANETNKRNEQYMPQGFNQPQQASFTELSKLNNIDCAPWKVDESMFVLPSGVDFIDYESMKKQNSIISTPSQSPASACSACDKVPAESKAQCKTALKCN
jgi:uncharacterized protein YxeA